MRIHKKEDGPAVTSEATSTEQPSNHHEARTSQHNVNAQVLVSAQVSWYAVHEWVQRYLGAVGEYPWPGTPAWCLLPDDSREKWAGILDFAQHHALRVETAQQAQADAAGEISAAADWSDIAQQIRRHNDFYAERPWMQRRSA